MAEQHAPIGPEALDEMRPIDSFGAIQQQVRHVCAIIAFAFHDVGLHPNHFLRRANLRRYIQHFLSRRAGKPGIVDFAQAVAAAVNDVDQIFALKDFRQPMRVRFLGAVAVSPKHLQR